MCRCTPSIRAPWCPNCPVGAGPDTKISPEVAERLRTALTDMSIELTSAMELWPAMNSAHEGYGVLMEEVDELWDIIKMKQRDRPLDKMRKEALQVAAMAVRFAVEICNEERGRK